MISFKLDEKTLRLLNESENQMLRYIYRHGKEICDMNVSEFAKISSCAPSSVVRFCKKIGYSGFAELKYALKSGIENNNQTEKITQTLSCQNILSDISTNIRGTANLLESEDIYKIAELLNSDIPVYLYFPGGITDNLVRYL